MFAKVSHLAWLPDKTGISFYFTSLFYFAVSKDPWYKDSGERFGFYLKALLIVTNKF
jgi:hypothetical protein